MATILLIPLLKIGGNTVGVDLMFACFFAVPYLLFQNFSSPVHCLQTPSFLYKHLISGGITLFQRKTLKH